MGKNELPHPKHRVAGTPTSPRKTDEDVRDEPASSDVPYTEDRFVDRIGDRSTLSTEELNAEITGEEPTSQGTPIAGDVLGSGANDEQPNGAPVLDENQGSPE